MNTTVLKTALAGMSLIGSGLTQSACSSTTTMHTEQLPNQDAYEQADKSASWKTVFVDSCTGDWSEKWHLDGEVGTVSTGPEGMHLTSGPEFGNDAHHMVLWAKPVFEGDLKIEYEYTRMDDENRCVNILYIQASGSGEGAYAQDIFEWNSLRRVPAMRMYYDNMHVYHISYAALGNTGTSDQQYIRARRYIPHATGLKGTELEPDYYPEGLFEKGVPHRIQVIKQDRNLYMRVENDKQINYYYFSNPNLPVITEGRVGLRQMFTRSARYKDFRISVPVSSW